MTIKAAQATLSTVSTHSGPWEADIKGIGEWASDKQQDFLLFARVLVFALGALKFDDEQFERTETTARRWQDISRVPENELNAYPTSEIGLILQVVRRSGACHVIGLSRALNE